MNLHEIQEVINNKLLSQKQKEELILKEIAKDDKAIPYILTLLQIERKENKELIEDMNVELSRTHICIKEPKMLDKMGKDFVLSKVKEFYLKYKDKIKHVFNEKFE